VRESIAAASIPVMHRHNRAASFSAAVLLLFPAAALYAVERGEPLGDALNELRGEGLQVIFSSALIEPGLTVDIDPGSGTPEQIARRILAPHGLALETIRPGLFSVVKRQPQAAPQPSPVVAERGLASEISQPLYEVEVYASRYQIDQQDASSLVELSREDLDGIAGVAEDALRVTRYLPGTASNTLSARSHVRGGREDELAIYFDGVPLYEPFHFKDVQGVLGILDPDNISSVDFFSGVFPVRYGNRLAGVLDMQPRKWRDENYYSLGASNLYFSALSHVRLETLPVEGLASLRYGNRSLLRDLLHFRQQESEPSFLDALGRVQVDFGSRGSVVLGWLLLQDEMEARLESGDRADLGYRDATGWASWEIRPGNGDQQLRVTVSRTERHTDRDGAIASPGGGLNSLDDRRRFDTTTARIEATVRTNDDLAFNAGAEWQGNDAAYLFRAEASFDPRFAAAVGRAPAFSRSEDFSVEANT
jgi:hypothetical protein